MKTKVKRATAALALVLAAVLMAASLAPAAAQQPPARALVRIDWRTEADLDRIAAAGVSVYARLESGGQTYFLAGASTEQAEALRAGGLSVTVLDAAVDPAGYFLAFVMPGQPAPDWQSYGRPLLHDGAQVLLRSAVQDAARLAQAGVQIAAVTLDPKPIKIAAPALAPAAVTWNANVQAMIDQVTPAKVSQYNRELAGELPIWVDGGEYTITTRYTYSGEPIRKATAYVGQKWAALGLNVEYQTWGGADYPNVIAQRTGTTTPGTIFIIGAHIDDLPGSGPAPGADDNASGVVAAMLAADIMTQYDWGCTLRFAAWTGEEQGMLGSRAYAQRASQNGEKIAGYLNLDMIAWNTANSDPVIDLYYADSVAGTWAMAQQFADVVTAYGLALVPTLGTGVGASDHYYFWQYGYKAILGIEDYGGDFNPNYHQSTDTPADTDLTYFTSFVKAAIADYAHLADCLAPTAIGLTRFDAWPEGRAIRVRWETASEIDTLGFNLYRGLSAEAWKTRIKLNETLIPTNAPPGSPFGASYDWVDGSRVHKNRTYFYWLEEVDTYGQTTLHGPVQVTTPKQPSGEFERDLTTPAAVLQ